MMAVVLVLIIGGGCVWAFIRLNKKYLSTEEQILEMMDETSISSETLWNLFERLN